MGATKSKGEYTVENNISFRDRHVSETRTGYVILHGSSSSSTQTKGELLRVLFADVVMGKQTRPLEVALSFTSASLLKVYKGEVSKLTLPELQ